MASVICPGCRRAWSLPEGLVQPSARCPGCGSEIPLAGQPAAFSSPASASTMPLPRHGAAFDPPAWAEVSQETPSFWLLAQALAAPLFGGLLGVFAAVAAHFAWGTQLTQSKLLLGPFFLAAGSFGMAAAVCDWEWLFGFSKMRLLAGALGRGPLRCAYGLLGAGMALFGLAFAVVPAGDANAAVAGVAPADANAPRARQFNAGTRGSAAADIPRGITVPTLRDPALEEAIRVFNALADALAGINDRASAERAAEKVQAAALQRYVLEDLLAKRHVVLAPAERARLAKLYDADLTAAKNRVVEETARVMAIEGAADVLRQRLAMVEGAAAGPDGQLPAGLPADLAAAEPAEPPATPGVGQPIPPRELPPQPEDEDDAPTLTIGTNSTLTKMAGAQGEWLVQPDPPPANEELAAYRAPTGKKAIIPFPKVFTGGTVYHPATPSQFVAIGGFFFQEGMVEVWNLATSKRTGRLPGGPQLSEPFALSGDGRTFAGAGPNFGQSVQVWSFDSGQGLWDFSLGDNQAEYIAFAGNELLTAALRTGHFQLWDLQAGKLAREFKAPTDVPLSSVALSPAARYLTAHIKEQGVLQIYDLQTLATAGALTIPKHDDWDLDCRAVAFSPDGRELAGLFEAWGLNHLLVWDLAGGEEVLHHTYSKDLQWLTNVFYNGPGLEWIPDGSGWLIFGNALLDRATGELLLSFPDDPQQAHPRKMLTDEHFLAVVEAADNTLALQVVPLPLEEIAAARAKAREQATALAVELPPLTPADWSQVRAVTLSADPAVWNVPADVPSPPRAALVAGPIALRTKKDDGRRLFFSGPEAAVALVWSVPKEQPGAAGLIVSGRAYNWLDRYDLTTGLHLGRMEVLAAIEGLDLSADGALFAACDAEKRERLDVWSLAENRHLAAWQPYANEPPEQRGVAWAAFVSANQLLTLNAAGKLVLWDVPACRAVYSLDRAAAGGWGALSANRRQLVGAVGQTLRVYDTSDGTRRGEVEISGSWESIGGQPALHAAAFGMEGSQLAAVFHATQNGRNVRKLARWDVASGQLLAEFIVPNGWESNSTLHWCGAGNLLLDGRHLVDLNRGRHIWGYQISWGGLGARDGVDDRYWYTAGGADDANYLAAARLPEPQVIRHVATVTAEGVKPLLAAGAEVSLALNFAGPPREAAAFKQRLLDEMAASLAVRGVGVGSGKSIAVNVQVREVNTGETMRIDELFGGKTHNVPLIDLHCTFTLSAGGRVVWSNENTVDAYRLWGIFHLPPGEDDPGAHLMTQQWDQAGGWLIGLVEGLEVHQLPDGTAVVFPGVSELTPDGPITPPLAGG